MSNDGRRISRIQQIRQITGEAHMIQQIFEGIANAIIRRPKLVAFFIAAIFLLGIYGMTMLSMQTGWKTYANEDSATGYLQQKYDDGFKSDSIIFIIETGDPLSPEILSYIDTLETDLRQQQNVESVYSITDVLRANNGGRLPSSKAETESIVNSLPQETRAIVYPSNILTPVQLKLISGLSDKVMESTLRNVDSVVDSSSPPPGVTVEISGTPAFNQQ
jgi:predicted RND superfamily exporter protein